MRLIFIIAALAAALSVMPSAQAAPLRASCALNHAAVAVSTSSQSTASGNFVDVAESSIRFVQGGTKDGCIIVSLSAEALADVNAGMAVRVVLDGTTECESSYSSFVKSDPSRSVRTANFLCTDVAPGAHRVKLQFSGNEGLVLLDVRTVTVQYFK